MELSGQNYALPFFSMENNPRYITNTRVGGIQSQYGHFKEEKSPWSYQLSRHNYLVSQSVALSPYRRSYSYSYLF